MRISLTGLLLIPYALTFPLTFSQTGLLGAGTQTAAWLWMAWILARPTTVIVYAMLKPGTAARPQLPTSRSPRRAILLSVLAAVCGVLAWTWITTAHENLLPVIMLDATRPAPFWRSTWGPAIVVMNVAALTILWFRRQSVLDLWLSVASLSWVLELLLLIFLDVRFSLGWYAARSFWVSSSSFVLLALISETDNSLHAACSGCRLTRS